MILNLTEEAAEEQLYQQLHLTFERGDVFSLSYGHDEERYTDIFIFLAVRKIEIGRTLYKRVECDVIHITVPKWESSIISGKVEKMRIMSNDIVEKT